MVELSTILDEFSGYKKQLVTLARVINSHGIDNYILRRRIDFLVENEEDPQSFIDGLQFYKVLAPVESKNACLNCQTPLLEETYCIICEMTPLKTGFLEFYKVLDTVIFADEWRSLLSEKIDQAADPLDREYLKLISAQVKSLEELPIIPIDLQKREEQYQLIGARILNYQFNINLESLAKLGRSDIKFSKVGEERVYIGEYKLWSNKSGNPVDQCLNYFVPETYSGFVFMVNDSKGNIWDKYLSDYVEASASHQKAITSEYILRSNLHYINVYRSYHHCHISNKTVAIYHFIYDLYGNFGSRIKKPKVIKAPMAISNAKTVTQRKVSSSKKIKKA